MPQKKKRGRGEKGREKKRAHLQESKGGGGGGCTSEREKNGNKVWPPRLSPSFMILERGEKKENMQPYVYSLLLFSLFVREKEGGREKREGGKKELTAKKPTGKTPGRKPSSSVHTTMILLALGFLGGRGRKGKEKEEEKFAKKGKRKDEGGHTMFAVSALHQRGETGGKGKKGREAGWGTLQERGHFPLFEAQKKRGRETYSIT